MTTRLSISVTKDPLDPWLGFLGPRSLNIINLKHLFWLCHSKIVRKRHVSVINKNVTQKKRKPTFKINRDIAEKDSEPQYTEKSPE